MLLKEVSFAQQGCIYLLKNTVKLLFCKILIIVQFKLILIYPKMWFMPVMEFLDVAQILNLVVFMVSHYAFSVKVITIETESSNPTVAFCTTDMHTSCSDCGKAGSGAGICVSHWLECVCMRERERDGQTYFFNWLWLGERTCLVL